jgi:iron complex outermembrane receptor protein
MKQVIRLCAVLGVLAGHQVAAQEGYRQTVVVTAAATPVELGTVTRSVTVITREQLAALPVQSIADVLRLAASVDVRARGERGVQTDFSVRGASFGQMLVLVDGVRINDAQSGHHNGDIPVPLDAVERIEVMYGPGSSLFGADAFGGTINVITRSASAGAASADRALTPSLTLAGGSFGSGQVRGVAGGSRGAVGEMVAASFDRSGGFIDGRDFRTGIVQSRTAVGRSSNVSASYLWKDFGARNFYGAAATGDAMSRERTNQTMVSATHAFGDVAGWTFNGNASYRTHGDRFVFTPTTPASLHRTHEALGTVTASRSVRRGGTMTLGSDGGETWIRSNNLGDHTLRRISGFGEWRQGVGSRAEFDASVRLDEYSEFGSSWSPAAGVSFWVSSRLRLRASGGRAFRVPTFTERYYSDRNHLARPEVGPEHSWAGEGGAEFFPSANWMVQATLFGRADRDVIDWLCSDFSCGTPAATDRWRTYNVRNVATRGAELTVRRIFGRDAFVQAGYTGLTVDAPAITQKSKYLLDYSPRSLTAAALVPVGGGLRVAPRLEVRRHRNTSGTSDYALLDVRVSRRFASLYELAVDGTNLFDTNYEEVVGVRMPGAAALVSLRVGR